MSRDDAILYEACYKNEKDRANTLHIHYRSFKRSFKSFGIRSIYPLSEGVI